MKQIILKWLTKTAIRELRDIIDRNLPKEQQGELLDIVLTLEAKAKPGCGKDILEILYQALRTYIKI